jgi:hypothetical protein
MLGDQLEFRRAFAMLSIWELEQEAQGELVKRA